MKFSEIIQKLSEKFVLLSSGVANDVQIYRTIPAKGQRTSSDEVLTYSSELCKVNSDELRGSLLWCGGKPDALDLSNVNRIEVKKEDFLPAVKAVDEMLHYEYKFQSLKMCMMDLLMNGKGLKAVVDEMAKRLDTSIVIIDMTGKIITHSSPFMIVDQIWTESIDRGFCPPFFIEHIRDIRTKHTGRLDPGPVENYCEESKLYYLSCRLFMYGELCGYVFMLQKSDDFNPYCRDVINYIGQATTEYVFKNVGMDNIKCSYYVNLLTDMFRGIPSEQIIARISAGEMRFPARMCIAALRPKYFQGDKYVENNLAHMVKQLFPNEHFVYYRKMLIVLLSLESKASELPADYRKALETLCAQENLFVGISNPFSKVTSTKHYYDQAVKSIELATRLGLEGDVQEYRNIALYDMINSNAENHKVGFYCHPALLQLIEYDAANGSQLHDTLKCLAKNGFNSGETAAELFLHRNTLAYRKQKISELTGLNLDDFDTQFLLRLSFAIEKYMHKNAEIYNSL